MNRDPLQIIPAVVTKLKWSNQQLGAVVRLDCIAMRDDDGALPDGANLAELCQWDGTEEEFAIILARAIPHPYLEGRLTTEWVQACRKMKEAAQENKKKKIAGIVQTEIERLRSDIRREVRQEAHQQLIAKTQKRRDRSPVRDGVNLAKYKF